MTATPAWPLNSLPRLFIDDLLSLDNSYHIETQAAHYLTRVMRRAVGDPIKVFDDRSGEYLAEIIDISKRHCSIKIIEKLRAREEVPDLWLCAAPIKRDRWAMMAEKACELGVSTFVPIHTQRTIIDKIKGDKLRYHMIEAAEQCERNALPTMQPLQNLKPFLEAFPENRRLYFCDERGGDNFHSILEQNQGPAAILIGPEGGFTDEENALIRTHPAAQGVSLGPRILRAETAAIAAISVWMSHQGDW